jgi:head-tail adaptor
MRLSKKITFELLVKLGVYLDGVGQDFKFGRQYFALISGTWCREHMKSSKRKLNPVLQISVRGQGNVNGICVYY